jgi:16S rRNA (guanine527-N7)-methyltransferase
VEIEELLRNGLNAIGLTPSEQQINAFIIYLSELKKWNRVYNLTGIKRDEDIVVKHFLDSLLYLKAMPAGEIDVADVGSGAGFPGVPIKIVRPEIEMYLMEPLTRALFDVKDFVRKASPVVKKGGILILSKGPKVREELKTVKDTRYDLLTVALPLSGIKRHLVVVRINETLSD